VAAYRISPFVAKGEEAAMADVGTKKLFENEKIVVWEMCLEPGEKTDTHTHSRDCFVYVIAGSAMEAGDKDGNIVAQMEIAAGSSMYLGMDGGEMVMGNVRFPATHDARNVGSRRYRELLIEFK
jgi:redox-sensitive bicupin YhaK (pirin superfamily)